MGLHDRFDNGNERIVMETRMDCALNHLLKENFKRMKELFIAALPFFCRDEAEQAAETIRQLPYNEKLCCHDESCGFWVAKARGGKGACSAEGLRKIHFAASLTIDKHNKDNYIGGEERGEERRGG